MAVVYTYAVCPYVCEFHALYNFMITNGLFMIFTSLNHVAKNTDIQISLFIHLSDNVRTGFIPVDLKIRNDSWRILI